MKNKKAILISGIASVLTATIIFVSGGSTLIAAILGGAGICTIPGAIHLNTKEQRNKNNTTYVQQTAPMQNSPKVINSSEEQVFVISPEKRAFANMVVIAPIKQYDDTQEQTIITELITTDALSQQEDVLVRRRKKETEERTRPNNDYKK